MTVAQLIELLKTLPQDVSVSVNDERSRKFHEDIEDAFYVPEDKEHGDRACVILVVNTLN